MKSPRGRLIAISVGILGLALLTIAGFAFRERIREEYWLWRLEREEETGQRLAVKRLGELRSLRAVPRLLECACPPKNFWRQGLVDEVKAALSSMGPEVIPVLIELSEDMGSSDSAFTGSQIMLLKLAVSRHPAVRNGLKRDPE
jgi:hypothetical protein